MCRRHAGRRRNLGLGLGRDGGHTRRRDRWQRRRWSTLPRLTAHRLLQQSVDIFKHDHCIAVALVRHGIVFVSLIWYAHRDEATRAIDRRADLASRDREWLPTMSAEKANRHGEPVACGVPNLAKSTILDRRGVSQLSSRPTLGNRLALP